MQRTLTTAGGFILMLMLGSIYSFSSTIEKPLALMTGASGYVSILPFVTVTAFLAIGAVVGGFSLEYVGARTLALAGAALWGIGNLLSGLDLYAFGMPWVAGWYGVFGGFGVGLAYIAVVSATIAWYPRARGLFSGLAVMGFGLGSTLYSVLLHALPAYGTLSDLINKSAWNATQSPAAIGAQLSSIFFISGGVFTVAGLTGAALLFRANTVEELDDVQKMSPLEIIGNGDIWVLWAMLFMNVSIGLFVITNVVTILNNLTQAPIPTIAAVFSVIAVANGLGRVIFGGISDVIGRRNTFFLIYGAQFIGYSLFDTPVASNLWFGTGIVILILLCYGGGFGTMPAYLCDVAGIKNFAPSYGIVLSAWGVAGVVAPLFAIYSRQTGIPITSTLMPLGVVVGIAMVFPMLVTIRVGDDKDDSIIAATASFPIRSSS